MHAAVRYLLEARPEAELTIPAIASQAGVTPSTIYRRWGSLTELLADVAVERLRPDGEPEDTGSFAGDLEAWLEQFADEMSSRPGQAMVRDVLASPSGPQMACRCTGYIVDQLGILVERAGHRGETAPPVDQLIDLLVAPVMYRLHFIGEPMTGTYREDLLQRALKVRR